ncbi:MAG TPA: PilC/PilY family type IV pilus protein [Gammaproteobacteria bacterium]|nr:PilC/PilY family type IV pilus protein [Gammaproteobacteria bacterium]
MVYFGTGKYLEKNDKNPDTARAQSFYGIWDRDFSTNSASSLLNVYASLSGPTNQVSRNNLVQQEIDAQQSQSGDTLRRDQQSVTYTNDNSTTKREWYLDLKQKGSTPTSDEMVIVDPVMGARQLYLPRSSRTRSSVSQVVRDF